MGCHRSCNFEKLPILPIIILIFETVLTSYYWVSMITQYVNISYQEGQIVFLLKCDKNKCEISIRYYETIHVRVCNCHSKSRCAGMHDLPYRILIWLTSLRGLFRLLESYYFIYFSSKSWISIECHDNQGNPKNPNSPKYNCSLKHKMNGPYSPIETCLVCDIYWVSWLGTDHRIILNPRAILTN